MKLIKHALFTIQIKAVEIKTNLSSAVYSNKIILMALFNEKNYKMKMV